MTFCQCSSKLCSILTFFGSSQRVARGGAKRPCKRERAFFLRKTCSQIEQLTDKRDNELHSHTFPRSSCFPCLHTTRPTHTRHTRNTRIPAVSCITCALPCIACIACITRPAACCVSCMPFPTARQENAEKRHEVAKCQRFGAVNRP